MLTTQNKKVSQSRLCYTIVLEDTTVDPTLYLSPGYPRYLPLSRIFRWPPGPGWLDLSGGHMPGWPDLSGGYMPGGLKMGLEELF